MFASLEFSIWAQTRWIAIRERTWTIRIECISSHDHIIMRIINLTTFVSIGKPHFVNLFDYQFHSNNWRWSIDTIGKWYSIVCILNRIHIIGYIKSSARHLISVFTFSLFSVGCHRGWSMKLFVFLPKKQTLILFDLKRIVSRSIWLSPKKENCHMNNTLSLNA